MELLAQIAQDHREVQSLIRRIEMTSERGVKTRQKYFDKLEINLLSHMQSEEAILYNSFEENDETRDLWFEGMDEHRIIRMLLGELEQVPNDKPAWKPKIKVLKEILNLHIEEEEEDFFNTARTIFTGDELREMGDSFQDEKNRWLAAARGTMRQAA